MIVIYDDEYKRAINGHNIFLYLVGRAWRM